MDRVKILHCSDLHIDTPFKDLPESISEKRKEEVKETFINIVDLCKKEEIQILLIAGDFFDNLRVYKASIELIKRKFKEIYKTKIFISAGNHDPYNKKSFYDLIHWPKNVYVFKNNIEEIVLEDFNTVICGFSFNENYIKERKLKGYKVPKKYENYIKIMVCHGVLTTEGAANRGEIFYNPIVEEDIKNIDVDYLALGHTHTFSGIKKIGNTFYSYSGCPEGRNFNELGDKGILIGTIGKEYANLEFKAICKRKYIEITIDITEAISYKDIEKKILNELENIENNYNKNLYKIILIGELEENFIFKEELLLEKLKDRFFFLKIEDKTTIKIDYTKISKEYSIKGIFVCKLLKKIKETSDLEEKEILKNALKIGVQSLLEQEVRLDDN